MTRPSLYTYIAKRDDLEKMARDLIEVVTNGDVKIPIHATHRLDEVVAVHKALEARETTGATVLVP